MTLELDVLTPDQAETAREWRNHALGGLRTPYPLTAQMQADFYDQVVNDRRAPHRYWALMRMVNPQRGVRVFVGMVGLTDIQWENGLAEISLLVDPSKTGQGIGRQAVDLVLEQAFSRMRLATVCGECYEINPAIHFWKAIGARYQAEFVILPRRKFWEGLLHDALYFSISADAWRAIRIARDVDAERMNRESTDAPLSPA